MPAGFALALLAQAAAADPVPPPQAKAPVTKAQDGCTDPRPKSDSGQIVICAPKSDGYRLNPDVMEAKRELRGGGRKKRPENFKDRPCAAGVGPAPCMTAGINLIGAALTAAEMAKRVADGKEIGSMFVTDPHPSEYQLYVMAKARREAREAEAKAAAKAKADAAKADAGKASAPRE